MMPRVIAVGTHVTPTVRLLRPLGAGGMGSVWVAEHLALQTHVVVKFMSTELARDKSNVERFAREAAAASQVKSPHVVQMFDHGVTQDGVPFIVMELLEGHDVMFHLKQRGRFLPQEVATIVVQTCKALSKAHEKGIIHRDVKPENIFALEGDELFVKLLDFGIAKASGALSSHTGTGAMIGTPFYMSPEQIVGAHGLDYRADLWSLAIVAFELLTGKKPFEADTIGGLAVQIHNPATPRPSQFANDLPLAVDAWFMRACARSADERFQSAKEMAQAFVDAVGGMSASMIRLPSHVAATQASQQSGGWGATPPPSQPHEPPQVPQLQATGLPVAAQFPAPPPPPPPRQPASLPPPAPLPAPRHNMPAAFAETAPLPENGMLPGMPMMAPPQQPAGFPAPPPQGFPAPPVGTFEPSMSVATPVEKKSKAPLVIGLVVLLLAIGGGVTAFFLMQTPTPEPEPAAAASTEDDAPKKKKKPKKTEEEPAPEPEPEPTAKPEPTATAAAKPKPTATAAPTPSTTALTPTPTPTTKPSVAPVVPGKKKDDDDIK